MGEQVKRRWVCPQGVVFDLCVREQMVNDGWHLRRLRRVHFESLDRSVLGDALVPGHFMLDLANAFDLYELWERAVGKPPARELDLCGGGIDGWG